MKRGFLMMTAACAFCAAASAGQLDGTVSLSYSYLNVEDVSWDANTIDIGGVAKYDFGNNWNAQAALDYSYFWSGSDGLNNYLAGGAIFWRNAQFAAGAYGYYNNWSQGGHSLYWGTYGAVGEYYIRPDVTLRGNLGGMLLANRSGISGGAGIGYYVIPDASLNFDFDVNHFEGLTWYDLKVGGEYLISHEYPLTVGGYYTYSRYSDSGSIGIHALMIKLAWHLGDSGSLADLDRTGPLKTPVPSLLPI